MERETREPTECRQCKKFVKNEVHRCKVCDKNFHPGCVRLHKIYNENNELVLCKGRVEVYTFKTATCSKGDNTNDGNKKRKLLDNDNNHTAGNLDEYGNKIARISHRKSLDEKLDEVLEIIWNQL